MDPPKLAMTNPMLSELLECRSDFVLITLLVWTCALRGVLLPVTRAGAQNRPTPRRSVSRVRLMVVLILMRTVRTTTRCPPCSGPIRCLFGVNDVFSAVDIVRGLGLVLLCRGLVWLGRRYRWIRYIGYDGLR